ncbi:GNAT family N-acetyltransferase [Psychrobacter sp. I-STPA10]|uniref:GNAT family N-acetyltransferase n=1 Tax=Psychrobacter sp. I-STPA10 TaxID=2585769 RepID=UPI001E318446|nr:GNAT family N-acetyltransferase [Psychrobacter sp. I-STPA10]
MAYKLSIKTFDELTNVDLYHILRARSQVFVVEQNCAYQDIDEVDFDCLHLVAHQNEMLIGYCRIIAPEFSTLMPKTIGVYGAKPMPSIGRVLVMPEYRGTGLARKMMKQAIKYCHKHYRKIPIIISAQTYLTQFYQSLGFVIDGMPYLEDGIEHVTMILDPNQKKKGKTISVAATTTKLLYGLLVLLAAVFIIGLLYLMV